MGRSYFIWKGTDCRNMGVQLQEALPIIRGEERVEHMSIPGRSGDLTMTEGNRIFESYIQTAKIAVKGAQRVPEILNWLTGAGYLTTGSEPNRQQLARVIGAVTLNPHSRNLDWWTGEAQFYCQPLKEALREGKITMTAAGTVYNHGDVIAKPYYKVTANSSGGTIVLQVTHTSGSSTVREELTIPGISGSGNVYIDCETGIILNNDQSVLLNSISSGDFPVLQPGDNNYLGGSGWASVEITKRERYL